MDKLVFISILGMGGIGLFFACVLAAANSRLAVKENPKIEEIENALPKVNCGSCGFLNCHEYAVALAEGGQPINACKPGGEDVEKRLADILGVEAEAMVKKIAVVHCAANGTVRKKKAEYRGIKTCAAKNMLKGGDVLCDYGCLGSGDCALACPFDAVKMEDGLPLVDPVKCVACGKCISACPRGIISLEEIENCEIIYVACSSRDKGPATRKICPVGCIACGICQKVSSGAFEVNNNLAVPTYEKLKIVEKKRRDYVKMPN
ncbi:MAG: RnfABCDGE type electron transport complex subunit B [Candidatus Omnitrophica bacterium]|nr:RnfABCDGE type electron transport complex subunit B [Candidatus Omnitrophota bacterium]